MENGNYGIRQRILNYAQNRGKFGVNQLETELEIKTNTARQYLCILTKENKVMRIGNGKYMLANKQLFKFNPPQTLQKMYRELKDALPYTNFCIYDGSIFSSLQHHVSVNRAIYIEASRDAVDTVFARLKESQEKVYKRPDSSFIYDYVNLQDSCIIVKPFVTEAPTNKVNEVTVPSLEKLLVDILTDDDFDYMQGIEASYIYQYAFNQYAVNTQKVFRYAKRRGAYKNIYSLAKHLHLI